MTVFRQKSETDQSPVRLRKGLPSHAEAEQCVIGAIFLDPIFAIPHTLGNLTDEDFYIPAHKKIFNVMKKLHRGGNALDVVTVGAALEVNDLIDVGGNDYLCLLADSTPTAANVKYYVKILKRETERRRKVLAGVGLIEAGYAGDVVIGKGFVRMADVLEDVLSDAYSAATEGRYSGYASGFAELDDYLGGLKQGELYVIAARPSMGKSALCAQMADNIYGMGGRVAFFPLEIGTKGLARNIASMHTATETWKLRGGKGHFHSENEVTALVAYLELQRRGIFSMSMAKTPQGVETSIREMISEHGGLDIIFIDHLQEMLPDKQSYGGKRHYEIETILQEVRRMAREFNVPVVLAAQVGRSAEGREPSISEIKDCGSIEQIADVIVIIHGADRGTGQRSLNIAKHRHGATGKINLWLQGEYLKFRESIT